MNLSKKLGVFMLALLTVASGCLGSGTTEGDEEVVPTVNNYYWNNTTVIQDAPNYMAISGQGEYPGSHLSIIQSAGEATNLLDIHTNNTGMRVTFNVYTNCTGGWQFEEYVSTQGANSGTLSSDAPQWLAGEGLECTHDFRTGYGANWEHQVTAIYLQVPVTVA